MKGGFAELKEELHELMSTILTRNAIDASEIGRSVFGMSGVDVKMQHTEISKYIRDLGIQDFILCNDSFLSVKAGCEDGFGIGVVNGTGCTIAGIDSSGSMLQIGGLGFISGMEGGGGMLGMKAVRSVYAYLFLDGPETCLKKLVFKEIGITADDDFLDKLIPGLASGSIKTSELNRLVFIAANDGDEAAITLLTEMGNGIARGVNACINKLDFPEKIIEIALMGSINAKAENPTALQVMKQKIISGNLDKNIQFTMLTCPPVAGAAIWALDQDGNRKVIYNKIINDFTSAI